MQKEENEDKSSKINALCTAIMLIFFSNGTSKNNSHYVGVPKIGKFLPNC